MSPADLWNSSGVLPRLAQKGGVWNCLRVSWSGRKSGCRKNACAPAVRKSALEGRGRPIPPESLPVNRFPECDCWASLNGKHLIVSALKIGGAHPFLLSFGHSGVMKCVEKIKTTSAVLAFISLRAASWIVPDHIRRPAEKAFLYHISNNLRKDIKINALRRFYPAFRRLGKKQ